MFIFPNLKINFFISVLILMLIMSTLIFSQVKSIKELEDNIKNTKDFLFIFNGFTHLFEK